MLTYDVDSSHVRIAIFVAFVQIQYFVNHVTDFYNLMVQK